MIAHDLLEGTNASSQRKATSYPLISRTVFLISRCVHLPTTNFPSFPTSTSRIPVNGTRPFLILLSHPTLHGLVKPNSTSKIIRIPWNLDPLTLITITSSMFLPSMPVLLEIDVLPEDVPHEHLQIMGRTIMTILSILTILTWISTIHTFPLQKSLIDMPKIPLMRSPTSTSKIYVYSIPMLTHPMMMIHLTIVNYLTMTFPTITSTFIVNSAIPALLVTNVTTSLRNAFCTRINVPSKGPSDAPHSISVLPLPVHV